MGGLAVCARSVAGYRTDDPSVTAALGRGGGVHDPRGGEGSP